MPATGGSEPGAAASAGAPMVGAIDPNQPVIENPPLLADISCAPGDDPLGPTPLKRLSKLQYRNAASNVFNLTGAQHFGSEIAREVLTNYALIPEDSKLVPNTGIRTALTGFDKTDSTVSQYHTDGAFFVGLATGATFTKNQDWLKSALQAATQRLKGTEDCSGLPPSDTCVRSFIASFGRRAFRRPLTPAELDDYEAMYRELATVDYLAGISAVVTRFFMSPQFLYQVELDGTPLEGRSDLLTLTPYELASRLAFTLHDDIPDAELDAAAEAGSLSTEAGYATQVERLLLSAETAQPTLRTNISGDSLNETTPYQASYTPAQIVIDNFFSQWLKMYANKSFEYSNLNLQALADRDHPTYLSAGQHHQHFNALQQEVINLYSHLTWNTPGTFAELMTTDKLAYPGTDAELLLDHPAWGSGQPQWPFWNVADAPPMPSYPAGERDGLLNRAFFLMSGNEIANPVHRGVFVQRQLLCNPLPSPDPNALPDRALEAPEAQPNASTRERFATKTAPALCQTCHAAINPTGFAFENFDSLGRVRTQELVFGPNHDVIGSPAVDSSGSIVLDDATPIAVQNGSELMHAIAGSQVANECFARQYFRFVFGRTETQGDGCVLTELYDASTQRGMLAMFEQVTHTPGFKLHRVGPQ